MGLDRLGDDLVAALATAAGVHAPAPPGTAAEEKQVYSETSQITTGIPLGVPDLMRQVFNCAMQRECFS